MQDLPIKYFILDVDDSLVDTEGAICKIILDDHGFECPADTYLDPSNTNGHHPVVIGEAKFMRTAIPFPGTLELFKAIPTLHAMGARFPICTHRGYHAEGYNHTLALLTQHGMEQYIDEIHVLDYNVIPDKVTYLDNIYGAGNYLLFDDRPRFDQSHALPDHIWLYDRPWNQHIQGNRTNCILTTIRSILEVA